MLECRFLSPPLLLRVSPGFASAPPSVLAVIGDVGGETAEVTSSSA